MDTNSELLIKCRAKVSKQCYDGKRMKAVYEDESAYRDDGTYQSTDDTIVCDSCYITIGQPSVPVQEGPRRRLEFVNETLKAWKEDNGV